MFLSGDNFNKLSNVSIYERKYYNRYIKYSITNLIFINENNTNVINKIKNTKNIIFTKIEYISYFINIILPHLTQKFILITHNSDNCSGSNDIILNNPLLVKWYGQNMILNSNKTYGIPIGLENKIWNRTNFTLIQKYANNSKNKILYLNFSLNTNSERKNIMKTLLNNGFKNNEKLPWNEYIKNLSNHKFAISPEGNGYDCHRTWECIYLGVIPIVIKSTPLNFFNELPILFVNNYNDITPKYLNEIYNTKFKNKKFNLEKLKMEFWKNKFLEDLKK